MLEKIVTDGPKPKVEIDGETLTFSPLTLHDFGEFRDWVKEKRLATFLRAADKAGMDQSDFRNGIQDILGVTPEVNEENGEIDDDVIAQMGTEVGMEHLIFLSVKKEHPEIEKEDLGLSFQDLEQLTEIISEISGLPTQEEEDTGNPPEAGTEMT